MLRSTLFMRTVFTMRMTFTLVVIFALAATLSAQQMAHDLFLTFDYPQGYGDCDLDNLILEDENGAEYTIDFNNGAPLPGGTFEPYSGALFWEGDYLYEALTVDFTLDTIDGYFHHHPIPVGGVGGSGYLYSHPAMAIRVFRLDGLEFRMKSLDYRGAELPLKIGTQHVPTSWSNQQNQLNVNSWVTFEMPVLGPAASGAVGTNAGGPYSVLEVAGSAGGSARRVDVALNAPVTFDMLQPPTNTAPADFLLFGMAGVPTAQDTVSLGIHGDMVFTPGNGSFLLATSQPSFPGALLPGQTTPWTATVLGAPSPLTVTLQGVISETATTVKTTNAVVLRIQ